MRLAFLTHEPFHPPSGGGSAAAGYLVRELVRRGHEVHVFGPELPDPAAVEARFGIRLHAFRGWRMGRTTPLRTPKYLLYPAALARLVRETMAEGLRLDGIVAQHSIACVAAGLVKRSTGVPIVFNLLDCLTGFLETWPPWMMPRPVAHALVRYELSLPARHAADGVMTVSDHLRDLVVNRGFPAERALAIHYGFDAALFRRSPAIPKSPGPSRIVMHGSFDQHHLGRIARRAVIHVGRHRPDVHFRFVGPPTPALNAFLGDVRRGLPSDAKIEVTGFVPYESIAAQLADATIGITPYEPSTGTHCAFVAKTVEYLALGLPVVSTPLESAVRYYRGLEAVKFSRPDGSDFGDRILEWLGTPDSARSLAVEPAGRKVIEELDWTVVCERAAAFTEARLTGHPAR